MSHDVNALFFENNSQHEDGDGTDQLVQNAILGKNVDRAVFGSDLAKLKQETRTVRRRILSKEEIDFHLLMALVFHDLSRKKFRAVVKRCMDLTFHDDFEVKKMYTELHDIMMKYVRVVNLIMNTLFILKVICYNQFACIELNETINHMLSHGFELKSLDINCVSDWKNPVGRYTSEFLMK